MKTVVNHEASGFAIHPASYRKGFHVVTIKGDGSGFKTDAMQFIEDRGGQYVGRYGGYIVPDSRAASILSGLSVLLPTPYQLLSQLVDFVRARNGTIEGMDANTMHAFGRKAEHALAEHDRLTQERTDRDIPVLDALQACYEAGRLIQRGERGGATMGTVSIATDGAKAALKGAGRTLAHEPGPDDNGYCSEMGQSRGTGMGSR